jgi:hypothetical protein
MSALPITSTFDASGLTPGQLVDRIMDRVSLRLADARRRYPRDNYGARIYFCHECAALNGAVAPADELWDEYPCVCCGGTQVPWTDVATYIAPPRPNRRRRHR